MLESQESTRRETPTPRGVPVWAFPAVLVLLVAALIAVVIRLIPPAPLPATAPGDQFAAGRALAVLRELAGSGAPHPLGSAEHDRVRDRVAAAFTRLGYAPRVEKGVYCHPGGICGEVENVLAELPGKDPGSAVLLLAHYDSVAAGPGIADDLAGVAALLEVARILKAGPQPRHSILFLADDGEEAGLLGAEAFAQSPEAGRVKTLVNLEARGTGGPSLMFETGRSDLWLMPHFAGKIRRPATSSLFTTIYDYLPNDTDFTVFKRRGVSGFNFAFIGNPNHYHSPLDNLKNLSARSLQHQGENALATVRSLAGSDLTPPLQARRGQAVFFDVLTWKVFWWPAGRSPLLGGIACLLLLVTAVRLFRRRLLNLPQLALGMAAWLAGLLASVIVAFGLAALLRALGGLAPAWPMRSFPTQATFWLLSFVVLGFVSGAFRRAGFLGLWTGLWLGWGGLGLVLAFTVPDACYLFLLPALAAGATGLLLGRTPPIRWASFLAVLVPALTAALLWFPLAALLYGGLGSPGLWVIAGFVALALLPATPLFGTAGIWWRGGALFLGILLFVIMGVGIVASPRVSEDSPKRFNINYHLDAETGKARWLLGTAPPLPPEIRKLGEFAKPVPPFPWNLPAQRTFSREAPGLALAPPQLTVLADASVPAGEAGARRLRLRFSSPRGARTVSVAIPAAAGAQAITVAGHPLRPGRGGKFVTRNGWVLITLLTTPPEGAELEVLVSGRGPQEWYVFDRTAGLPAEGRELLQARPGSSVPIQDGDGTLVSRKVVL